MSAGVASAWLLWPAALLMGAFFALPIGAVSLRTRGVYFIMITLAFAQMVYYLVLAARAGQRRRAHAWRTSVARFLASTTPRSTGVALAILLSALCYAGEPRRSVSSLQGARDNETRMEAIGFPTSVEARLAFVIASASAGLAAAARQPEWAGRSQPAALDRSGDC